MFDRQTGATHCLIENLYSTSINDQMIICFGKVHTAIEEIQILFKKIINDILMTFLLRTIFC